jgi:hypothetical protein
MRKSAAVVIAASTTVGALLVASPAGAVKPSGGKTFFFSTSDTTNGVTFDEADGTVTVDVNRSSSKGKASVTVQLAPGTADTADVGYAGSDVVRFASGEGTKTIALAIDDDNIVESAESFTLTLSAPSRGYSLDNTRGSVTGSITDADSVPDPNGIWTLQSGDTISLTDLTLGVCNDVFTCVLAS